MVLHGALVGGTSDLIVPHPRYTARQFVLKPACDVAADYRDPRFGWDLRTLSQHLDAGLPSVSLTGGDEQLRGELLDQLADRHGIAVFPERELSAQRRPVGKAPPESAATQQPVIANVPAAAGRDEWSQRGLAPQIPADVQQPWVSGFLPNLPDLASDQTCSSMIPRLVARIQRTTPAERWPAPHQMWPAGWQWPEYRLEVDDIDWAVDEIASALRSMRCPVKAVTADGNWWHD